MKVLFDTNVVLDFLLDRQPFSDIAANLFARVEYAELNGYICATTVTTIHYLVKKALGTEDANKHISSLLSLSQIIR